MAIDPGSPAAQMAMPIDIPLVTPRVPAVLDPGFRPAVLAVNAYNELVDRAGGGVPVRIALEQADGSVFRFDTRALPESHATGGGESALP